MKVENHNEYLEIMNKPEAELTSTERAWLREVSTLSGLFNKVSMTASSEDTVEAAAILFLAGVIYSIEKLTGANRRDEIYATVTRTIEVTAARIEAEPGFAQKIDELRNRLGGGGGKRGAA